MYSFTVTPDGIQKIVKDIHRKTIPFSVVFIFVTGAWILGNYWVNGTMDGSLMVTFVIVLAVSVISFLNYSRKYEKMFKDYKLTVTDESFVREMGLTPTITIAKKDVKSIMKAKNGGFAIIGDSKINAIGVPPYINQPELLERLLVEVKPITNHQSNGIMQKYFVLIVLGICAALYYLLMSDNIFLSMIGTLALSVVLIWGFIFMQKSKNVEGRMKWMSYIIFIPLLSCIVVFVMKVMGLWDEL